LKIVKGNMAKTILPGQHAKAKKYQQKRGFEPAREHTGDNGDDAQNANQKQHAMRVIHENP
jgi:hypothetical protein